MKILPLALAALLSSPAFAQSWDVLLQKSEAARPPQEFVSAALSGGLTLFDIADRDFRDGEGIGLLGNVSVFDHGSDFGMIEVGWYELQTRQKVSDNPFRLDLVTIGGGYRWSVGGGTRLTMGLTGGLLYYFSPDISPKDELNDGIYVAFFASAHLSGPVGLYLRFSEMFLGSSGEIDGESLNWITGTTIGLDVQF